MATLYGTKRYNGDSSCWWRLRVDYSGTSATAYVDVGPSGWSIWLRFTTGTNTFSKSANTYYASNNGGSSNKLGSTTISETASTTITQTCSGSTWGGDVNASSSVTIPAQKASFNLNVLLPNGDEPYDTGTAGSVERSINGGSYARKYNEEASTYAIGTTFAYRNFSPGTGLHLSSVSGVSPNNTTGPWSLTLNSGTTVTFQTAWNTYKVKYNANGGSGSMSDTSATYGTSFKLRTNTFTRTGYTFAGWATSSGGSVAYSDGASVNNLTTTNGGTVNLYAKWNVNSYYLDLNGWLDGSSSGGISPHGYATVTVGGSNKGSVTDYYTSHPYGTSYSISNIGANWGYQYNGVYSGSLSGSIGASTTSVVLNFSTKKPWDVSITGTVTGPFNIDLNWTATGLNISNYAVYANGTRIYNGTGTSYSFAAAEETTYSFYVVATNVGGSTTSSTVTYMTPADQAKIRIRKGLPAGYERLNYIEATGTQYIDTGITMKTSTTIDCRFEVIDKVNDYLFGQEQNSNTMMYSGLYNASVYEYGWDAYSFPTADFIYMTQRIDGNTLITNINNSSFNMPINTTLPTYTTKIFGCNSNRYYKGKARVFFFVIKENGNPVIELYPCKRTSDSAIGMYDVVSNKFYPNLGTGTFGYGAITDWVKGKTYYKKDGQWLRAKKIYIKVNDQWKIGTNYD